MKNKREDIIISKIIEDKLMLYGLSPNHKGYLYAYEIIRKELDNDYTPFITNDVYEYVAKIHNTSSECIERDLRYSIDIGYTRTKQSLIEMEFKNTIGWDKSKPTNKQFLMTITNSIRYDIEMNLTKFDNNIILKS